jgi:hypothetical protein
LKRSKVKGVGKKGRAAKACAEANAIRPHSGTSKLIVINQVGESVASVGSSEEDEYYRNDSLKPKLQSASRRLHTSEEAVLPA